MTDFEINDYYLPILAIFLIIINLSYTSSHESVGYIRFIIRRVDRWSLFKEFIRLGPTYEGCLVEGSARSCIIIRFNTDRSNYIGLVDAFIDSKQIRIYYSKKWLRKYKVFRFDV